MLYEVITHIDYPRVKFRQWAEERGIAIAKFPKNANVTIVDTDVMDNILKSIKKVTIHKRAINAIDMPMVYVITSYSIHYTKLYDLSFQ